jgi:hypothetical protein
LRLIVRAENDFDTAVAKRKLIKTGRTSENPDEIIEGVADLIIVEGARSVKEDQQIRI